jgi:SHS2 domain-containing protein
MTYKFLEHTADVKFLAKGKTLEEAFISVAHALFEVMTEKEKIKEKIEKKIIINFDDSYRLLYDFVEEFLFLFESKGFVFSKVKSLKVEKNKLSCVVLGDYVKNYSLSTEVKAMTYSDMKIEKVKKGFEITGVFDV